MSSEKGNHSRTRPQKYKNRRVFKNDLHDKTPKNVMINNINVCDVCVRCKEIIEWKIKYKKYKPLSQPRKCVKCDNRTVKKAYHVICNDCGNRLKVCTKCLESKEIIPSVPTAQEQVKLDLEMQQLLKSLTERKRRTFLRYMSLKNKEEDKNVVEKKVDLMDKLNALKVEKDDDNDDDDESFEENDDSEDDCFSDSEDLSDVD